MLLRCALAEDARVKARREHINIDIETLLYTKEGIPAAREIWGEFEKARREIGRGEGREEPRDRELEWGRGDRTKSTFFISHFHKSFHKSGSEAEVGVRRSMYT